MSLSLILQAVQAGVTNGVVYALVAMGLVVIFRGSRVINVMQGEFSVVGAMVTVLMLTSARFPYWLAILAGAMTGPAIGAAIELILVRPMIRQRATDDQFVLLTIGLERAIAAAVLFFIGRDGYLLPAFGGDHAFIILDTVIRDHALWLVAIAVVVMVSLREFFRRTTLGLAITAASIDADGAATTGINVSRMRTLTFALGGLLGAIAGILITPLIAVDYQTGLPVTLKGIAAAILGGLANPLGAVVGGLILGLVESLVVVAVSSGYKDVLTFSILIAIMIFMPNGILARPGRGGG
jgi:branched-chain amino acid transport system permease protein